MKHIIYKDEFNNTIDYNNYTISGIIRKKKILLPQDEAINKKVKKEFKKTKTNKKITVYEMEKIIDKMINMRNKNIKTY